MPADCADRSRPTVRDAPFSTPHSECDALLGDHSETEALIEPSGRIVLEDSKHGLLSRCAPGCEQIAQHCRSDAGALMCRRDVKLLQSDLGRQLGDLKPADVLSIN